MRERPRWVLSIPDPGKTDFLRLGAEKSLAVSGEPGAEPAAAEQAGCPRGGKTGTGGSPPPAGTPPVAARLSEGAGRLSGGRLC